MTVTLLGNERTLDLGEFWVRIVLDHLPRGRGGREGFMRHYVVEDLAE